MCLKTGCHLNRGSDWQENLKILADVLDRLHKYNLHLKLLKFYF